MSKLELKTVINTLDTILLGKKKEILLSLTALLARGHLLLEDLPGMGKTTLAQGLAKILGLEFQRIQFTSDLLPGDVLGGEIFRQETGQMELYKGPIFTEVLLADEINRTTPKSQSALLEAMEERQVTLGNKSYALPEEFFVIATQNPVSLKAGTYPLPDSQLDRFLMCLSLGYPSFEAEKAILQGQNINALGTITPRFSKTLLFQAQAEVDEVFASDEILNYILRLVHYTRSEAIFQIGLSPRGSQAILQAAKAYAYLMGREYIIPEDIKMIFPAVAIHRLEGRHGVGERRSGEMETITPHSSHYSPHYLPRQREQFLVEKVLEAVPLFV